MSLTLTNIHKSYRQAGSMPLAILRGVNLDIKAGEMVALVGPSGSGKTTLLQIAGLLDGADSGEVIINGQATSAMKEAARTRIRRDAIGFVYQFHHLLPEFTALENAAMPLLIAGEKDTAYAKAESLLASLGLADRVMHTPSALSGGEQQRVAIARALIHQPALLIADEPTGNLDTESAAMVFEHFMQACRQQQLSVLMATHNPDLAAKMDRVVQMSDL